MQILVVILPKLEEWDLYMEIQYRAPIIDILRLSVTCCACCWTSRVNTSRNKEEEGEDKLVSRVPVPPEEKGERKLCYFHSYPQQVPLQRIYIATKGTRARQALTEKINANHNILTPNILLLHYTSSRRYGASLRFALSTYWCMNAWVTANYIGLRLLPSRLGLIILASCRPFTSCTTIPIIKISLQDPC